MSTWESKSLPEDTYAIMDGKTVVLFVKVTSYQDAEEKAGKHLGWYKIFPYLIVKNINVLI